MGINLQKYINFYLQKFVLNSRWSRGGAESKKKRVFSANCPLFFCRYILKNITQHNFQNL